MARWASLVKLRRTEHPVMLVDAGDFCTIRRERMQQVKARYFFEGMKLLGYDALGIGERDISFGRARLLETAKSYQLQLVSSNIRDKATGRHIVQPYIIKDIGGTRTLFGRKGSVRVGIFSVVLPTFVHKADRQAMEYYTIVNPKISALEMVTKLRERGCDLVVALSHQGWNKSFELARGVPGIDIVLNGHRSHNGTHSEMAGNTIVVDTGVKHSSFTEILVTYRDNRPVTKALDLGGKLLKLKGDPDLIELEKRFEEEKRASRTNPGP